MLIIIKKFRKCSGLLNNLKIIVFLQFIFLFFHFSGKTLRGNKLLIIIEIGLYWCGSLCKKTVKKKRFWVELKIVILFIYLCCVCFNIKIKNSKENILL